MTDSTASLPDAGSLLDGEPIAEVSPAARRTRQARVVWGSNVVTVGGDAGSIVLKSAVAPMPSATMPLCQLAGAPYVPPAGLVQVPLAAWDMREPTSNARPAGIILPKCDLFMVQGVGGSSDN